MESLKNNVLVWIVVGISVLNLGSFFIFKIGVDKISDKVIEKLQKEYSPSPYGPGIDPDKVDPNALKTTFEVKNVEKVPSHDVVNKVENWESNWERERGVR